MHKPIKLIYAILAALVIGGVVYMFVQKLHRESDGVNTMFVGSYTATEGVAHLTVSEINTGLRVVGTTVYPGPGNTETDDYTGYIDGNLVLSSESQGVYTDLRDKECVITVALTQDILTVSGAAENCDVLLSGFDGVYYRQSTERNSLCNGMGYSIESVSLNKLEKGLLIKCLDSDQGSITHLSISDEKGNTKNIFSTSTDILSRGIINIKTIDIDLDGSDEISFMVSDGVGRCNGYRDHQYLYNISTYELYDKMIIADTSVSCDAYTDVHIEYSANVDTANHAVKTYLDKTLVPRIWNN